MTINELFKRACEFGIEDDDMKIKCWGAGIYVDIEVDGISLSRL